MTDPSKEGQWKIIEPRFKYNPIHIALFHTGQVLTFGGSGNDPDKLKHWNKPEIYEPDYTGQTDGKIFEITNNGIEGDIFCAGHAPFYQTADCSLLEEPTSMMALLV